MIWERGGERVAFHGRSSALDLLRERWEAAVARHPSVLLLHGEAGIGKTAMLHRFLAELPGDTVLLASGDETERLLPYGVLDQLVPPTLRAERLATALARRAPADPLTIGASLVEQLGLLQQRGPVVLVIDDVHWADSPSLHAIGFALRRLRVDQVLTLLAVRDPADPRIPPVLQRVIDGPGGERIALGGLTALELQELSTTRASGRIGSALAERLHEHTGGNPLHAGALLDELDSDALRAVARDVLPAPRSFSQLVLDRLSGCTPTTVSLLTAASVLGMRAPLHEAGALAEVPEPLVAAEAAVAARLARLLRTERGQELEFTHPLVRAAVYHALATSARAALHERAVAVAKTEFEAAHHRLSAAVLPDEELAHDAEELARQAGERGLWAAAAGLLLRAASLTPTRADRDRRTLEAVEAHLLAGDTTEAVALAEGALDTCAPSPRLDYIQGRIALVRGDLRTAQRSLLEAWQGVRTLAEPQLTARIAGQLAAMLINAGEAGEGVIWADRCLAADPVSGPGTATVRATRLFALAASGRAEEALAIALDPPADADLTVAAADDLLGRGVVRMWTDDLDGALADLDRVVAAVRRIGPFHLRGIATFYRADALHRAGRIADAAADAEQALSSARDAEQVWMLGLSASVASWCQSALGAWETAEGDLEIGAQAAALLGDMANRLWVAVARARLAQAQGDAERQVAATRPLLDLAGGLGMEEPGVQPWRALLVEGLLGIGELDTAERELAVLQTRAAERGLRSQLAAAARLRGVLLAAREKPDAAEQAFAEAYGHLGALSSPRPFDLAMLERDHARALGPGPAGAKRLASARARFAVIGAEPFAASCTPVAAAEATGRGFVGLTGAERATATLASSGKTNREIAAELVVSVKTVEFHLSNVYAKLGLRSRTELAANLKRDA
jgi:DNA-binding NarL/FixJ family response regulator